MVTAGSMTWDEVLAWLASRGITVSPLASAAGGTVAALAGELMVVLALKGDTNPESSKDVKVGVGQAPDTGTPNSDYEQVDSDGQVRSRTHYDDNGYPDYRIDFDRGHGDIGGAHRHDFLFDPETGHLIDKDVIPLP